jgi:hypothetical protein
MPAAVMSPEDQATMQALAKKYGLKSVYLESDLLFNPNAPNTMRRPATYSGGLCPDCGDPMRICGGCETCNTCGFSKCG